MERGRFYKGVVHTIFNLAMHMDEIDPADGALFREYNHIPHCLAEPRHFGR